MKRELLLDLVGEIARVAGARDVIMIGSQVVHAVTAQVPGEVLMSRECDLLLDDSDPLTAALDAALGPESGLAAEQFVHVDTVSSTFPFLPDGWEARLIPLAPEAPHIRCLEVHDLVMSKLAAGRLKDYELVAVLFGRGLANIDVVRARVGSVSDLNMRAVLLARLQIVLESLRR
jgi:hypothetical protein